MMIRSLGHLIKEIAKTARAVTHPLIIINHLVLRLKPCSVIIYAIHLLKWRGAVGCCMVDEFSIAKAESIRTHIVK